MIETCPFSRANRNAHLVKRNPVAVPVALRSYPLCVPAELKLNDIALDQVVDLMALGSTLTQAAESVGVRPSTLSRRIANDAILRQRVERQRDHDRKTRKAESRQRSNTRKAAGVTPAMQPEHGRPVIELDELGNQIATGVRSRRRGGARLKSELLRAVAGGHQQSAPAWWVQEREESRALVQVRLRDADGRELDYRRVLPGEARHLVDDLGYEAFA